jgi:hypothetical protein
MSIDLSIAIAQMDLVFRLLTLWLRVTSMAVVQTVIIIIRVSAAVLVSFSGPDIRFFCEIINIPGP